MSTVFEKLDDGDPVDMMGLADLAVDVPLDVPKLSDEQANKAMKQFCQLNSLSAQEEGFIKMLCHVGGPIPEELLGCQFYDFHHDHVDSLVVFSLVTRFNWILGNKRVVVDAVGVGELAYLPAAANQHLGSAHRFREHIEGKRVEVFTCAGQAYMLDGKIKKVNCSEAAIFTRDMRGELVIRYPYYVEADFSFYRTKWYTAPDLTWKEVNILYWGFEFRLSNDPMVVLNFTETDVVTADNKIVGQNKSRFPPGSYACSVFGVARVFPTTKVPMTHREYLERLNSLGLMQFVDSKSPSIAPYPVWGTDLPIQDEVTIDSTEMRRYFSGVTRAGFFPILALLRSAKFKVGTYELLSKLNRLGVYHDGLSFRCSRFNQMGATFDVPQEMVQLVSGTKMLRSALTHGMMIDFQVITAGVVLIHETHGLVVTRPTTSPLYDIAGYGCVQADEEPLDAAWRELAEETSMTANQCTKIISLGEMNLKYSQFHGYIAWTNVEVHGREKREVAFGMDKTFRVDIAHLLYKLMRRGYFKPTKLKFHGHGYLRGKIKRKILSMVVKIDSTYEKVS
jgi:hypothetical protein